MGLAQSYFICDIFDRDPVSYTHLKTAQTARNMEENMKLQEIVSNRCGKEISQCTNEELYYALLEMTKGCLLYTSHIKSTE